MAAKKRRKSWFVPAITSALKYAAVTGVALSIARYVLNENRLFGIAICGLFYWITGYMIGTWQHNVIKQDTATLDSELFVARPTTPNQPREGTEFFTWTLATRLSDMLCEAENLFGERDKNYTILGVEFAAGYPRVFYPGNRRHVVIQLGLECMNDPRQACYQLAHEAVHLLSPTGGKNANCLEEGLAVVFSARYIKKYFSVHCQSSDYAYHQAGLAAEELLAGWPDAIKNLRQSEPTISKITDQALISACPGIRPSLVEYLCRPFVSDKGRIDARTESEMSASAPSCPKAML